MHVGKKLECCPSLGVCKKEMQTTSRERYLGDILTSDTKIDSNITDSYNKGIGFAN